MDSLWFEGDFFQSDLDYIVGNNDETNDEALKRMVTRVNLLTLIQTNLFSCSLELACIIQSLVYRMGSYITIRRHSSNYPSKYRTM